MNTLHLHTKKVKASELIEEEVSTIATEHLADDSLSLQYLVLELRKVTQSKDISDPLPLEKDVCLLKGSIIGSCRPCKLAQIVSELSNSGC